ncbi:hypothetical protein [Carboxylicivirga linearis]|uniref:Tsi6 domain-containing protein n=1 Tax=Carboxylicivirga linearis TaxID=1628157 RepID=A0ABS5JZ00_9BACT|nr:hypothetical protein [Carboxylicivirga linearis]MBS2100118.1 hypothetical protein [Carboxylicivirga linearis]
MNAKNKLINQIKIVINYLEVTYQERERTKILELIYMRYRNALRLLENNMANKDNLHINGGVRAYTDSYNDYNNPLLEEMYKAEKLVKEVFYPR